MEEPDGQVPSDIHGDGEMIYLLYLLQIDLMIALLLIKHGFWVVTLAFLTGWYMGRKK